MITLHADLQKQLDQIKSETCNIEVTSLSLYNQDKP